MNAIANRISGLPTTNGEVAYYSAGRHAEITRGMKLEKGQVKKRIGFVRQQDFLVECLTGESWYRNPSRDVLNRPHSSRNINLCMAVLLTLRPCRLTFFLKQAAKLRLPTHLSGDAISFIVEQTIDELGLRDAADTVVGGPLRKGISGGEKRCVLSRYCADTC